MKKWSFAVILFFSCFCSVLSAQSAEKVTEMLSTEKVTVSQTAYFAASWLNLIDDGASGADAVQKLSSAGIWKTSLKTDDKMNLSQFAGLCMKTWKIKGGLLYSVTHLDRYAFREFQAKDFIKRTEDPSAAVSGRRALILFTRCMELVEPAGEKQ